MQCSCGGETIIQVSVRKRRFTHPKTQAPGVIREELQVDTCTSCGRVGGARLYAVTGPHSKKLVARRY